MNGLVICTLLCAFYYFVEVYSSFPYFTKIAYYACYFSAAIFAAISASRPRADVAYCIHALARRLAKTHNWAVGIHFHSMSPVLA